MNGTRRSMKRSPSSAPATPRGRREAEEWRMPAIAGEDVTAKKARNELGTIISTAGTASVMPKQSPMPASPAPSVAMSPTRKESYKDLITRAISSHPDKLMTLSDIYAWIVANIEAYREQSHIPSTQGWKNAIRHTLSFYKCFKRVKRHPSIEKPSYWTIDYQEQQSGTGGATKTVPASPKSAVIVTTTTVPVAGSVIRPVSTAPGSFSSVIKDAMAEEHARQDIAEAGTSDLRPYSNVSWSPETHASKEEQCIQGLLLFRTSAGFGFLPKSNEYPSAFAASSKPALESSLRPDSITERAGFQPYNTRQESGAIPPMPPRTLNGTTTAVARSPMPSGTSVSVVVDTMVSTGHTWALKEQESPIGQEKEFIHPKPQMSHPLTLDIAPQPMKQESLSYVNLIANAILAAPERRATLAQIYEWLVRNVAAFKGQEASPSSVGWKNAVRHTLSTRPFFKRVICEEAFGRQKPAWWTVDVEAMNSASTMRQQQHAQTRMTRRKRNGYGMVSEAGQVPPTQGLPMVSPVQETSVIRRTSVDASTALMLSKSSSEPPELIQATGEELKPPMCEWTEKETASSPETTTVFRFPSMSVSSGGTTTSTISTYKSDIVSPNVDIAVERPFDMSQPADVVKSAIFESAVGLEMDVFECLLIQLTHSLDPASSWSQILSPRDALIFTLLRLRRNSSILEYIRRSRSRRQLKRLYLRWLTLLASQLSHLIIWPGPGTASGLPSHLADRLVSYERIDPVENILGVLDVFTMPIMFDRTDECCRQTVNAVLIYNFDGAIVYRSDLYWLDCQNHHSSYQSGLRSMMEDCFHRDLKGRLATGQDGGKILLTFTKIDDILPPSIHLVKSKKIRNLLRDKFADRLLRFDILAKPIKLRQKHSYAVTTLSYLEETLTVCAALLNLSPPINWHYDHNGI